TISSARVLISAWVRSLKPFQALSVMPVRAAAEPPTGESVRENGAAGEASVPMGTPLRAEKSAFQASTAVAWMLNAPLTGRFSVGANTPRNAAWLPGAMSARNGLSRAFTRWLSAPAPKAKDSVCGYEQKIQRSQRRSFLR